MYGSVKSSRSAPEPGCEALQPQPRVRRAVSRHSITSPGSAPATSTGPRSGNGLPGLRRRTSTSSSNDIPNANSLFQLVQVSG
ncbi:hypothetical protein STANM309S_05078 [Streptomyces tanashiensis]